MNVMKRVVSRALVGVRWPERPVLSAWLMGVLHLLCSFLSFPPRISQLCYVNHRSLLVDTWALEELIAGVGDIDRSAAFKALVTWVNMGEDVSGMRSLEEWGVCTGTFWLPTDSSVLVLIGGGVDAGPELPPVITAQQQQAEQMKVYWRVRPFIPSTVSSPETDDTSVRGDVDQPWRSTP
jgi:hypothetical protein